MSVNRSMKESRLKTEKFPDAVSRKNELYYQLKNLPALQKV
ncbi:hypothetical protein GCWU000342_00218 [Shuttleworthella satelles DSM 14600]|uniref:Uncharacterized protein n=1 Tax=Shuttleworthella satelles DSM 14600 TaxID=626523 RepID=C4GA65_9FIRM|nr:hypothetical protein GCWU000342_00218 [Shuttleworthia satelles DSM 14600]